MIHVGLYYRVKKGKMTEFEKIYYEVLKYLKENVEGFLDAKLYKNVEDPLEYLIYTEWRDLDSFKKFVTSKAFKDTTTYGMQEILEGTPRNKIFQEINI